MLHLTYLSSNADGGFNWSKVRDPELDRLLHEAIGEFDRDSWPSSSPC
jgi:hypothetical protein